MTNLYLFSTDRRMKYWAMWSHPPRDSDATLIAAPPPSGPMALKASFDQNDSVSWGCPSMTTTTGGGSQIKIR